MPEDPGPVGPDDVSTPHRASAFKALGAVVAVAVVPLALVVGHLPERAASPTVQPAADVGTPPYVPDWIAIQTGATSRITLNGPSGQIGTAQSLAPAANCGVNLGTSPQLITLQGSTGGAPSATLASYLSGSIGVKEKKSGTSCYQVNAVTTESLQIGLGTGVTGATSLGADAVATSAYLDVELKGGVRILATATLKNQPVPNGTFELQSGSERSTPVSTGAVEFECNPQADSGADSNISDNCRWPISAPSWLADDDGVVFDTLTLKALAGSFSLEGGADGAVLPAAPYASTPNASILEIASDTLGCSGKTEPTPGGGQTPVVTIYRLGNVDTTTACAPTPYSLNSGTRFAQFLKPLASQTSAQFVWDVKGQLPYTGDNTVLPNITINYETPDANGASPDVPLGWCPDSTYQPTAPFYAGYTTQQVAALPDQDNVAPGDTPNGKQYACVISRAANASNGDPDYLSYNDKVYVYGDARMQW
jgi:hypothetical protein